ncbi:MAG TPA: lanthionine synthetase LanC family protein [Thermoanaerobaculia bacterium]|nr:lanthionine synthetase LanC family protein [Thermoanaerobaculia bacterium]
MNITDPFVLKDDVVLIPCADLADDVRGRIAYDDGDFTLSRKHGRALAQVIDGETAALLELFREPRTIVEAILENSRSFGRDPETSLDELLPHLGKFLENRVLVPADSKEERESRPRFDAGASIAGWEIVRCAQLIEDSEIYQLRRGSDVAALKIARTAEVRELFENETALLRHLDGCGVTPRLIDAGVVEERPWIIMEWAAGVDSGVAAAQRRHDRAALIEICASIAAAYAEIHARGVIHADVHPRNIIVGDTLTLLDFGYSQFADRPSGLRGGINYFFEPELHAAIRDGGEQPPSAASEQYGLAALFYLLITGEHYLDFRLEHEEMVRQIEHDPPLPFAKRGLPPWPDVEAILFRALEKDPARRYVTIAEMAAALAEARDRAVAESLAAPLSEEASALLESTLQSFARGGAMFETRYTKPPLASMTFGSAGAAVGLLRIAESRGEPALLALADVWSSRAAALAGSDDAFYNDAEELPRSDIGDVTPYHTESGVHAAAAMITAAKGVYDSRNIDAFLRASRRPCAQIDLALGRSGSLLAAAMLLPLCDEFAEGAELRAFGSETMQSIWNELRERPAVDGYLGVAHGWAGYIYAALRWCTASGDAPPADLRDRLHALAALRIAEGRAAYWPSILDDPTYALTAGWCNGSAGHVFLFTLAHRFFGDDEWLQLAELAAWNTWDEPRADATLCCGTAGRAYALLNVYKHTGATVWLSRARQLANHAAATAPTSQWPRSLWKGDLGGAVLIADLASPENARMPFFE